MAITLKLKGLDALDRQIAEEHKKWLSEHIAPLFLSVVSSIASIESIPREEVEEKVEKVEDVIEGDIEISEEEAAERDIKTERDKEGINGDINTFLEQIGLSYHVLAHPGRWSTGRWSGRISKTYIRHKNVDLCLMATSEEENLKRNKVYLSVETEDEKQFLKYKIKGADRELIEGKIGEIAEEKITTKKGFFTRQLLKTTKYKIKGADEKPIEVEIKETAKKALVIIDDIKIERPITKKFLLITGKNEKEILNIISKNGHLCSFEKPVYDSVEKKIKEALELHTANLKRVQQDEKYALNRHKKLTTQQKKFNALKKTAGTALRKALGKQLSEKEKNLKNDVNKAKRQYLKCQKTREEAESKLDQVKQFKTEYEKYFKALKEEALLRAFQEGITRLIPTDGAEQEEMTASQETQPSSSNNPSSAPDGENETNPNNTTSPQDVDTGDGTPPETESATTEKEVSPKTQSATEEKEVTLPKTELTLEEEKENNGIDATLETKSTSEKKQEKTTKSPARDPDLEALQQFFNDKRLQNLQTHRESLQLHWEVTFLCKRVNQKLQSQLKEMQKAGSSPDEITQFKQIKKQQHYLKQTEILAKRLIDIYYERSKKHTRIEETLDSVSTITSFLGLSTGLGAAAFFGLGFLFPPFWLVSIILGWVSMVSYISTAITIGFMVYEAAHYGRSPSMKETVLTTVDVLITPLYWFGGAVLRNTARLFAHNGKAFTDVRTTFGDLSYAWNWILSNIVTDIFYAPWTIKDTISLWGSWKKRLQNTRSATTSKNLKSSLLVKQNAGEAAKQLKQIKNDFKEAAAQKETIKRLAQKKQNSEETTKQPEQTEPDSEETAKKPEQTEPDPEEAAKQPEQAEPDSEESTKQPEQTKPDSEKTTKQTEPDSTSADENPTEPTADQTTSQTTSNNSVNLPVAKEARIFGYVVIPTNQTYFNRHIDIVRLNEKFVVGKKDSGPLQEIKKILTAYLNPTREEGREHIPNKKSKKEQLKDISDAISDRPDFNNEKSKHYSSLQKLKISIDEQIKYLEQQYPNQVTANNTQQTQATLPHAASYHAQICSWSPGFFATREQQHRSLFNWTPRLFSSTPLDKVISTHRTYMSLKHDATFAERLDQLGKIQTAIADCSLEEKAKLTGKNEHSLIDFVNQEMEVLKQLIATSSALKDHNVILIGCKA